MKSFSGKEITGKTLIWGLLIFFVGTYNILKNTYASPIDSSIIEVIIPGFLGIVTAIYFGDYIRLKIKKLWNNLISKIRKKNRAFIWLKGDVEIGTNGI